MGDTPLFRPAFIRCSLPCSIKKTLQHQQRAFFGKGVTSNPSYLPAVFHSHSFTKAGFVKLEMDEYWSSLQSQIQPWNLSFSVFFLLINIPLTYLDPRTLFQILFVVSPFTQTKLVYKNAAHLVNYKIRPPLLVVPPPPNSFSSLTHLTSHVHDQNKIRHSNVLFQFQENKCFYNYFYF